MQLEDGRIRVGVDLTSVAAVRRSIDRYGERYLRRLFTATEIAEAVGAPAVRAERLAARFAAKEAVLKVLHCPADPPLWTDIEVVRDADGAPRLSLHGRAATLADASGVSRWAVSLTHEGPMAAAVVVADGAADPGESHDDVRACGCTHQPQATPEE